MVHLPALPGAPDFSGSMSDVTTHAVTDAKTLEDAGFDAIMVENFGDVPFHAESVPAVTASAMTYVISHISAEVAIPIGVNVLRNDGRSAMAIAAVTGASMIRVNVLSGTMFTDQGAISGRADEIARLRAGLDPSVAILADVFVKHAVPPPGSTIGQSATDLWERAGADALVVSGAGTGSPIDLEDAEAVKAAVPAAPLVIGSGATPNSLAALASVADSIIVGSALKESGRTELLVDGRLASNFVDQSRSCGFTARS